MSGIVSSVTVSPLSSKLSPAISSVGRVVLPVAAPLPDAEGAGPSVGESEMSGMSSGLEGADSACQLSDAFVLANAAMDKGHTSSNMGGNPLIIPPTT